MVPIYMISDIKHRYPRRCSDWWQVLNIQCKPTLIELSLGYPNEIAIRVGDSGTFWNMVEHSGIICTASLSMLCIALPCTALHN